MLESLLGNQTIEKVLFYLLVNRSCYAKELADRFGSSISPFQRALDRLERGGVIVSTLKGRTRMYQFNPHYPFLVELEAFFTKAYTFLSVERKKKYYESLIRKRPRKRNKP